MFIFNDNFYKNSNGEYFTKEYLEHQGNFDGKIWKIGTQEYVMESAEEIRAEYGSGKVIRCNYSQLFRDDDSMVLCNNIASFGNDNGDCLELENGTDYDEENDRYEDIFQWYIINDTLAENLKRHTDEIIYYHNELDIYILGVTHWGTSWDYVCAEYKL